MAVFFGPYEVIERVADGSTGTVYRARHADLDRIAAIKELSPELRRIPGQLERMRHEAEILATLESPHIVDIYDYVEEPDRAWIAEQWVTGATLKNILTTHGRLTPEQSVGVVRGALMGLAHAHDRGLVHRDFAPGNVLADMAGTSILIDFGVAAPVGDTDALGTPAYISPEAVRGDPIVKSSDVYSVAAVLFELLSGQPPFPAPDVPTMLRRHLEDPAPTLQGFGADLPDLLHRSMDKDPAVRPPDAGAFLAELEQAAKRRFGAGWEQRASIVGIVGSVVAVTAGAATAGAAAGGGAAPVVAAGVHAAQTVVVGSAAIATGVRNLPEKVAKTGRWPVVAGAAAVVVVVGIAGTAIALNGGDNDGSPSTTTESSSDPTPSESTPPPPTFAELDPTGVYKLEQVVVSTDFRDAKIGDTTRRTWTFEPKNCRAAQCSGTIVSSSGLVLTYTWNGSRLVLAKLKPNIVEGLCVSNDTGKNIPGSHFKATTTYVNTPLVAAGGAPADEAAPPTKFTGFQTVKEVTTELSPGCRDTDGVNHSRLAITLTLKRA